MGFDHFATQSEYFLRATRIIKRCIKRADKRKSVRQRLDNPKGKNQAVFLVGCGRSGTNMVTRRLARSWQVDLYNEDNQEAFNNWRLREVSVIDDLIENGYAHIKLFKPIVETHLSAMFLSRYTTGKILFVYRHFNDVINSSINHFGEERWYSRVKAWVDDDFTEFLPALVPEKTKQFIYSLWDPSLIPVSVLGIYWIFYNRLYFDLGLHEHDRVMLLNYENLVLEPEKSFQNICNFLSLKYYSHMVDDIFSSSIKKRKNSFN
ncbi:unnamed protein product [marine sediment metagenome]|uniref:Sulfotransferase domain-containing protein n=1 Tax=marine sediment metagenome TaxID=412755 RepID=X1A4W4_9ZZZZ